LFNVVKNAGHSLWGFTSYDQMQHCALGICTCQVAENSGTEARCRSMRSLA